MPSNFWNKKMGLTFDPTINLGAIVSIIVYGGAGLAFVLWLKSDIKLLSFRMESVEKVTMHLSVVITQQAVQNNRLDQQAERMNRLDRRLDGLSRGEGFIVSRDSEDRSS